MTIKEAQSLFINILESKGIKDVNNLDCFYSPYSKRLTCIGYTYASMLMPNNITKFNCSIPVSHKSNNILNKSINSFYYITPANYGMNYHNINNINNDINSELIVFDPNFKLKINLLGGIDQWWNKVCSEYDKNKEL